MTVAGGIGERPPYSAGAILRRVIANLRTSFSALARPSRTALGMRRAWGPAGQAFIVSAALIAAVAAAMLWLDEWEIPFHRQMPHWLLVLSSVVSDAGKSSWFLVPSGMVLVGLAAVTSPRVGRTAYLTLWAIAARVAFVFFAIALPSLVGTVAKRLIGRARPPLFHQAGPFDFALFSWQVEYASMPSGHATTVFAAAIAIGAMFPRARVVMWIYAGLVALSRVVLAAHYPSDVIAGAAVGTAGALFVRWWFAARRLGFAIGPDGAVHALPGPSLQRIKRVARRVFGQ